jgi:hypothetical protein
MKVRIVVVSALVILAVCWVLAAQDYMVILRNGKFLRAREPMKVVGKNVHITLVSGTLVSYPVDQIDFVQSERYNKLGLGGAWIIDELTQDVVMPPTRTPTPRLSDFGILMDEQFAPRDLPPTPRFSSATFPTATARWRPLAMLDRNRLYLFGISRDPAAVHLRPAVTDTDKGLTTITLAARRSC